MLCLRVSKSNKFDCVLGTIGVDKCIFTGARRPMQHQNSSSTILLCNVDELLHFFLVDDELNDSLWRVLLDPERIRVGSGFLFVAS